MSNHTESDDSDEPYDEETVAALRRIAESDASCAEYAEVFLEMAAEEGKIESK